MLPGGACWMTIGMFVMRKMINFKFEALAMSSIKSLRS